MNLEIIRDYRLYKNKNATYVKYKITIKTPCHLFITLFLPTNIAKNNITLANIVITISPLELLLNGKGRISELTPRIQKILKIFEPTIFPIAISDCFLYAATAEVANSGNDVPTATIVKPINY